jgi:hypothetical protein
MENNIQIQGFRKLEWVLYAAIVFACFLLFNQGDLNHTVRSSYAFLNGHAGDFYDYNKTVMGGNNYLPIIYIVFAVWFYPLHIIHLTSFMNEEYLYLSPLEIIWAKMLLVLIFFACSWLVFKCSEVIGGYDASYYKRLYLTSPLAIFSVFIFSQYDVIGSFFTLAAFYLYLKRKFSWSSVIFSLAISCKFFAAFIFIPLIFLAEKNIIKISKYFFLGAFAVALQFAFYVKSNAFIDGVLMIPKGKVNVASASQNMIMDVQLYGVIAYLINVVNSYVKKVDNEYDFYKEAILLSALSYAIMFSVVVWHPQWLIIIVPFFVMSYRYVLNKKIFYVFDLIGMVAFVWICVNQWVSNVDVSMISKGALSAYIHDIPLYMSDVYRPQLYKINTTVFRIYLFAPFIMIFLNKYYKNNNPDFSETMGYYVRYIGGVFAFVIPALVCAFTPVSLASKISRDACLTQLTPDVMKNEPDAIIGEIFGNVKVHQKFISKQDGFEAISVFFTTYMRQLYSSVIITVYDNDGVIITKTVVPGRDMINSKYYTIFFSRQERSKNKVYNIEISSPTATSGLAPTVLKIDRNINGSNLYYNNKPISGSLYMRLYYAKKSDLYSYCTR